KVISDCTVRARRSNGIGSLFASRYHCEVPKAAAFQMKKRKVRIWMILLRSHRIEVRQVTAQEVVTIGDAILCQYSRLGLIYYGEQHANLVWAGAFRAGVYVDA